MSTAGELILDHVERHARLRPAATAVYEFSARSEQPREQTWAELDAAADRTATALLELGVAPGDAVSYQLPNRLEFITISLATLRIGAVCEPLMPIFRERELDFMLRQSAARVLVVPDSFRGHDHEAMVRGLQAALGDLEHVIVVGEHNPLERYVADADAIGARRPTRDRMAQLLFTSGSTGEPKGVLHPHATLSAAATAHIRHFGLGAEDVIYVPSPLAHQTGFLYGMWIALTLGVPQVLQESWDPNLGFDAIQRTGVTFVQAATPFLADLVAVARERDEMPARLRTFVAAGAAIPRELAREARSVLGAEVGGAWGSTESCLGTAFAPGDPPELAWSTDGRALSGVGLRIVDDLGRELPIGAEGNFEVLTPCMFAGYLNRPGLTDAAVTADGWYRTGDLARIDADGYLRITGRVKDVINRGGEKVPVAEIEQLLYRHPAVREVAIVAMPDERLGERACAFVVLEPGGELDLTAMREYLDAERVAKTYWPERLEFVDSLPQTPSGKVQKFVLRELAAGLVAPAHSGAAK
ncbi:MAG TPA: AMP-binding protein [Solirubrobacteraceae bacterium]